MGGSEDIHLEGCWQGFRGNLQALGVAQGGGRAWGRGCSTEMDPLAGAEQFACTPEVRLQSQDGLSIPMCLLSFG